MPKEKAHSEKRYQAQTDVIRQVMPRDRVPGPDVLLATLDKPLPKDVVKKIIKLNRQKIPRSKIAKQLGISKLQVNHALMQKGGKIS